MRAQDDLMLENRSSNPLNQTAVPVIASASIAYQFLEKWPQLAYSLYSLFYDYIHMYDGVNNSKNYKGEYGMCGIAIGIKIFGSHNIHANSVHPLVG